MRAIFATAAVVAALALLWIRAPDKGASPIGPLEPLPLSFGVVPIVDCVWDVARETAALFAARQETPCVLRASALVAQWRALRLWTIEHLAATVAQWESVYRNPPGRRVFGPYYAPGRPLEGATGMQRAANYHDVVGTMSGAEFARALAAPSPPNPLHYFTGNLGRILEFSTYNLLADLNGFEAFELAPESRRQNINLWVGPAGPVTHLHYDSYANFNVQITGSKVWTLLPPSFESLVQPYPFLHPSHAQSSLSNLSAGWRPGGASPDPKMGQPLRGTLFAGDVLYIPPLWWHQVETVEASISVNFWSLTSQSAAMEEVFAHLEALQLDKASGRVERVAQAQSLVVRLLSETILFFDADNSDEVSAASVFAARLLHARYAHLSFSPEPSTEKALVALCRSGDLPRAVRDFRLEARWAESPHVRAIERFLLTLPASTRDVWTGNVVEYIGAVALAPTLVKAFLESCF